MPELRFGAAAAILAILSTSCNTQPARTIGVVPKGSTHIFWQAVHAGAVKAARERGYEILWNAPAQEGDRSRQIAIVESMINQRVAGIALAPCDRAALSGVVDRAAARGIPVAIFDSGIDTAKHIGFIGTNNREGGRVAARRLGSAIGGQGLVAIISDVPGSASTTERIEGFAETVRAMFPKIRLLGPEFCEASRAKARDVAENLLSAHPDLSAIFADHENAISGTVLAVKGRGRRAVKLVGFDASETLVNDLREGWIDALVVQDPLRMGYESVNAIALKLKGGSPPAETDTGATLVRASDLGRPEIGELLFPKVDLYLRQ